MVPLGSVSLTVDNFLLMCYLPSDFGVLYEGDEAELLGSLLSFLGC